jgi:hypothetical protein
MSYWHRHTVRSDSTTDADLYIQEPTLTALDIAFLQTLGFHVLEHPEAANHIAQGTFLFVPYLDWKIEALYRAKAVHCEVYISTDLKSVLEHTEEMYADASDAQIAQDDRAIVKMVDNAIENARAVQASHTAFKLPEFEPSNALNLTLYMKKGTSEDWNDVDVQIEHE